MNGEIERVSQFDHSYVEVAKKYDPYLGEYKIKRNTLGDDLVLVKEHQTTSKSQAISILNNLAKRKEMRVPNLMQLRDFSCKDDSHLCGTFYNYKSYYEYYDMNLNKFKDKVGNSENGINEIFLTKLLYDMVEFWLTLDRRFGRTSEAEHNPRRH